MPGAAQCARFSNLRVEFVRKAANSSTPWIEIYCKQGVEKLAPNFTKIVLTFGFNLDLFSSFTPLFVDFRPYGWYRMNIWKKFQLRLIFIKIRLFLRPEPAPDLLKAELTDSPEQLERHRFGDERGREPTK